MTTVLTKRTAGRKSHRTAEEYGSARFRPSLAVTLFRLHAPQKSKELPLQKKRIIWREYQPRKAAERQHLKSQQNIVLP